MSSSEAVQTKLVIGKPTIDTLISRALQISQPFLTAPALEAHRDENQIIIQQKAFKWAAIYEYRLIFSSQDIDENKTNVIVALDIKPKFFYWFRLVLLMLCAFNIYWWLFVNGRISPMYGFVTIIGFVGVVIREKKQTKTINQLVSSILETL